MEDKTIHISPNASLPRDTNLLKTLERYFEVFEDPDINKLVRIHGLFDTNSSFSIAPENFITTYWNK